MKFKPLEEMTFAQRFLLTIVIVVVLVLALAAFGYLTGRWDDSSVQAQPLITSSKWDDHIDELEKQGLDDAFKKHIAQLYSIWVTDNYQPKIPPKALTGARNARDAYIRSMEAIEKREQIPRR